MCGREPGGGSRIRTGKARLRLSRLWSSDSAGVRGRGAWATTNSPIAYGEKEGSGQKPARQTLSRMGC